MIIKRILICGLVCGMGYFAHADASFIPRVTLESQSYETQFSSSDYVAPGIGFTYVGANKVYFDFEFFRNNGDADTKGEVTREETTLTLGQSLSNGLSAFVGYKIARSVGLNELTSTETEKRELEIDTDGGFLGLSKSFAVDPKSTFAFSAALSPMTSRVSIEINNNGDETVFEESAVGLSANVAYNRALTKALITSVGYKHQQFSYGKDIGDETISALYIKLAYRL